MIEAVSKKLTRNDLGLTGGHQAGICVPRSIVNLNFFPLLDEKTYNPRKKIRCLYQGKEIFFNYIYYNNRLFGSGTRNEYRLTGMSTFFRENKCETDDVLEFKKNGENYLISILKGTNQDYNEVLLEDSPIIIKADWSYKAGIDYEY